MIFHAKCMKDDPHKEAAYRERDEALDIIAKVRRPITVDGIAYNKPMLEALKKFVVKKRDEDLFAGNFESAIMLSHVHLVLHHYESQILYE